jgi:hypothetical protein
MSDPCQLMCRDELAARRKQEAYLTVPEPWSLSGKSRQLCRRKGVIIRANVQFNIL